MRDPHRYIPSLGSGCLTNLYDPLCKVFMPESRFKHQMIQEAQIKSNDRILDVGCGTSTLMIWTKQLYPDTEVSGIDGDEKVLSIAQAKADKADVQINLNRGMSFTLPYAEQSFDHVFSSLMIHHLETRNKKRTFKEIHRVLVPGGQFHLADFGPPHNKMAQMISFFIRRLEQVSDNIRGLLPQMLRNAGFEQIEQQAKFMTIFGTLVLLNARKGNG